MLKLLLKFIGHPLVWSTALFLLLGAAAWFGLPELPIFEQRADADPFRKGALAALGVLWLATLVGLLVAWLRRERPLRRLVSEKPAPSALDKKLQELRRRQQAAQRAADRLPPTVTGGDRPGLLLIGPPGAGKSTALRNSELSVHHLDADSSVFEVRPTPDLEWVRCGDAVLIDTAGRYTLDDSARDEWRGLLGLLREDRGGRGVDGVVVCVSLAQLAALDAQAAGVLGERLRRQLDDVVEALGTTPATHLVLTHCDGLAGFSEWFSSLQGAATQQPWGLAFPAAAQSQADLEADLHKRFDELLRALEANRSEAFDGQLTPTAFHQRLLFPAQLGSLRAPLGNLVRALTLRAPGQDRCPLVGVWFTSAQQEDAGRDRVEAELAGGLGLPPARRVAPPRRARSRPLFLRQLFGEILTRHAARNQISSAEHVRRQRRQLALIAAAFGVTVLGSVGLMGAVSVNRDHTRVVRAQLSSLEEALARPGAASPPAELVARLMVLGDWTDLGWTDKDQPFSCDEELVDWAYETAGVERASFWSRIWQRGVRRRLEAPAEALLRQLTQREVAAFTGQLIDRRLAQLDTIGARLPELPDLEGGEPLQEAWRDWIPMAQQVCTVGRAWQGRYQKRGEEAPPAISTNALQALWEAELERARRPASELPAAAAAASLFQRWAAPPPPHPSVVEQLLPSPGLMNAVCERLDPITPAHLLFASFQAGQPLPERLNLQPNLFFYWEDPPRKSPPGGFNTASCLQLDGSLAALLEDEGYEEVDREAAVAETRGLYQQGYDELWLRWYENFNTPAAKDHRLKKADLAELGGVLKTVYRTRDGELERILALMGRGPAVAPPDGEDAEELRRWDWCECQADAWWAAREMVTPEGRLQSDLIVLQDAMMQLAGTLESLPGSKEGRRKLVQDTFQGYGVLYEAQRAAKKLVDDVGAMQKDTLAQPDCQTISRQKEVQSFLRSHTNASLNLVWSLLLQDYQDQVHSLWREEVVNDWASLRRRFPFTETQQEVDIDDLRELLGAGGKAEAFFATYLEPLLRDGASSPALWQGASNLEVTGAALGWRKQREHQQALLEELEEPRAMTFSSTRQTDSSITQLTITQRGSALLDYTFGGPVSETVQLAPGDALTFGAYRGAGRSSRCGSVTEGGQWPLLRLVTSRLIAAGASSGQRVRLSFSGESCSFSWDYQESGEGPLWLHRQLIGLYLPETLLTWIPG